jgi:UDP-N-acetylglucosamine 3-dehydrogenase
MTLPSNAPSPRYRVAIIGAGRPWRSEGSTGFGMSHAHAQGYQKTGKCELAAVADISEENAREFAEKYDIPKTYTDYREMLATEKPDLVSVCVWPHLHAEMVIAAAEAGAKGIHCEKPMARTWGESRRMHQAAKTSGCKLTFNHQRRFLDTFQAAKRLIDEGAIGELQRLEGQCGDLYDWGTHWLDMFFFYNNETPAEWVIGQIDRRSEDRKVFGHQLEDQGLCHFKFQNDVRGLLITGYQAKLGADNRIIGSDGVIEVRNEQPNVRIRAKGDADWRAVETSEGLHGGVAIDRAMADLVDSIGADRTPLLSSRHAIQSTEVIFAAYESSRRRGRVDLPLEIEDNPLHTMLEQGIVGPRATG